MSQSRIHHNKAQHSDTLVDAVNAGAQGVVDAGTNIYNAAIEQSKEATRQVDEYVRSYPWHAIGIAAGAGLLAGLMLRRR